MKSNKRHPGFSFSKISCSLALITLVSCATQLPANAASLTGTNLIVNGDAEAGPGSASGNDIEPVPGWTTTSNFTVVQYGASSFPSATDPGPANRGLNFFAGGPNNASSSATQTIDLSTISSTINSGNTTFNLSGFLGGFDGQDDNAVLTANFFNSAKVNLGSASIGPVLAADRNGTTGLLPESQTGTIPIGTTNVQLLLSMTRQAGSYNDGYADNLSFTLSTPSTSVPEPSSALGILALGTLYAGSALKGIKASKRRVKPQ